MDQRPARSRLVPTVVLAVAGALVAFALFLFATSPGARSAATPPVSGDSAGSPGGPPSLRVEALEIAPGDARNVVDLSGVAHAVRRVVIGAETSGRIVNVAAEENAFIEEGGVLVQLDTALAEAAIQRLRASVARAQASFGLARAEVGRQRDLSRGGASADADLERAESEQAVTSAQVAEANAQLKEALTTLEKLQITAPFAGWVTDLDLEPGAYLRTGDPVAGLADLSEVEIEVGVSDREIVAIRDGDAVEVRFDVHPGERFEGHVVRPGRAPDTDTQKYPVPIHIANPDERLLPGMLGTVRFTLGEAASVVRIPRRAVRTEFELDYVFVLEPAEPGAAIARRRRVTTSAVAFRPELREVTAGLEPGERIAISGLGGLRDGARVEVVGEEGMLGARR